MWGCGWDGGTGRRAEPPQHRGESGCDKGTAAVPRTAPFQGAAPLWGRLRGKALSRGWLPPAEPAGLLGLIAGGGRAPRPHGCPIAGARRERLSGGAGEAARDLAGAGVLKGRLSLPRAVTGARPSAITAPVPGAASQRCTELAQGSAWRGCLRAGGRRGWHTGCTPGTGPWWCPLPGQPPPCAMPGCPGWTLEPVPQPILTLLPRVTALLSAQTNPPVAAGGAHEAATPLRSGESQWGSLPWHHHHHHPGEGAGAHRPSLLPSTPNQA